MNITRLPGIYIHIPFCASKCAYCDFYSITSTEYREAFLPSLLNEIKLRLSTLDVASEFDTIYLGGGTPSLLSNHELEQLLSVLHLHAPLSSDPEITIEVNPESLNRAKLEHYREAGINRLSIGFQSYRDEELRYLERIHSVSRAREAFQMARETGFDNISIDLIHTLPEQTPEQWYVSLQNVLNDKPEHISAYGLIFEEGTPFHHKILNKEIMAKDEDEELSFYSMTIDTLAAGGYLHYEISNFAISDNHVSRHNYKYWNHAHYLGFGPSAHSFWNKDRWSNVRSVKEYVSRLNTDIMPVDYQEHLDDKDLLFEAIFLQLRTIRGIDLAEFENRYHCSFMDTYQNVVHDLIRADYAVTDGKRFNLTRKGLYISDEILPIFVPV